MFRLAEQNNTSTGSSGQLANGHVFAERRHRNPHLKDTATFGPIRRLFRSLAEQNNTSTGSSGQLANGHVFAEKRNSVSGNFARFTRENNREIKKWFTLAEQNNAFTGSSGQSDVEGEERQPRHDDEEEDEERQPKHDDEEEGEERQPRHDDEEEGEERRPRHDDEEEDDEERSPRRRGGRGGDQEDVSEEDIERFALRHNIQ